MVAMVLVGSWAHAALNQDYSQTFAGGTVPVGNPVGVAFSGVFNSDPNGFSPVTAITVSLNVSGGYSGGFYVYLVGPDGTSTVTLLNTPSTATPLGASFNITLSGGGTAITSSTDFSQNYPNSGGTYQPAGSLTGFNGQSPDGTWTLYFADLSSGGGNATLNGWSLDITDSSPVPEPINYALAIFGLVFVGGGIGRCYLARKHQVV